MKATGPGPGLGNFSKNGLRDNFVCMQDLRPIFGSLLCDFGKGGREGQIGHTVPPPDPHLGVMVGEICRGWGLDNIIGGGRGGGGGGLLEQSALESNSLIRTYMYFLVP